jgi:hypothetical protein
VESDQEQPRWRQFSLVVAITIVLLTCILLSWLDRRAGVILHDPSGEAGDAMTGTAPRLVPASASSSDYFKVQTGFNQHDDLFHCRVDGSNHNCDNLTRSPGITETWPVVNVSGTDPEEVAYYGIGKSGTELFVMTLPGSSGLPLTIGAGGSGLHSEFEITPIRPPRFSPNGRWIAFPAQNTRGVTEVFVAERNGQEVRRVTDLGGSIRDYTWLAQNTLVVEVLSSGESLQHWTAEIRSGAIRLTPLEDAEVPGEDDTTP